MLVNSGSTLSVFLENTSLPTAKEMKPRSETKALAAVLLVTLASPQAPALADDAAAEIRFLKKRLMQLEEKVARQDKQIRGVAKFPAIPPAPETPAIVCKDQPCPEPPPPPPPVFVSFANGLKVESWDG